MTTTQSGVGPAGVGVGVAAGAGACAGVSGLVGIGAPDMAAATLGTKCVSNASSELPPKKADPGQLFAGLTP
ncbi:MAG: hypothetical protein AAGK00_06985 [Pseudomonadota bacterium]